MRIRPSGAAGKRLVPLAGVGRILSAALAWLHCWWNGVRPSRSYRSAVLIIFAGRWGSMAQSDSYGRCALNIQWFLA